MIDTVKETKHTLETEYLEEVKSHIADLYMVGFVTWDEVQGSQVVVGLLGAFH
jgi:hypothetical protein